MKITMTIETGNDAFSYSEEEEIARLVQHVADAIKHGSDEGRLVDFNGNAVGHWTKS